MQGAEAWPSRRPLAPCALEQAAVPLFRRIAVCGGAEHPPACLTSVSGLFANKDEELMRRFFLYKHLHGRNALHEICKLLIKSLLIIFYNVGDSSSISRRLPKL